jgi:hypothetical protein
MRNVRQVPRLLAVALLALLLTSTALAARGEPQRQIRAADQARAKAMLLKRTDLPPGFKVAPADTSSESDPYCKALDESDLTLTGDADSEFRKPPFQVSSTANVYESVADANASWRRGTSAAGIRCLRRVFATELAKQGNVKLRSFKRIPFPRVAQRSVAFRIEVRSQGIPLYLDLPVLQHGRAHASLAFISGFAPVPKAEQVRLARLVAARAATAMRGA